MTRYLLVGILTASLLSLRPALTYATPSHSGPLYSLAELRAEDGALARKALANLEDPAALKMLADLGISKDEAHARIAGLSDTEIEGLMQGQGLRAGGDILYVALMVLLIIFVAKRI